MREAVAVFKDAASLETAVAELRDSGFAQDDISILAGSETVESKLGHVYTKVEELEDVPDAPREAFIPAKELAGHERTLTGALTILPTLAAAGVVVASTGGIAALVAGTAVAGALIGTAFSGFMDSQHASNLENQLETGGVLLWVRTPDAAAEQKAVEILERYAAEDVHIHDLPDHAPAS